MLKDLLLIGSGGHAVSCIDVIENTGLYKIKGIIGLPHEVGSELCGYPILGSDNDLQAMLKLASNAIIAIGQIKTPVMRKNLYANLIGLGYHLPPILSPHAYVSPHAFIGEGTIVMHGAIINAHVRIGCNCIINSRALIEHGAEIGDHVHLSTSCVINGDVKIGSGTFVGSGALIRQSLNIGENCVIGMGQQIIKECPHDTHLPPLRNN